MDSTALDAELDVWQAAGCAFRIDYSRTVMEELRLAACDGLNRLAHGGVEIGGVLFGVRGPDAVKVLAHRALACEYAFGPSFTLWDNDKRALAELLASPDTDSDLSGLQPVGWYHSHTRSEILLSEKDLQLFQQYFPEVWQIALVLRPYRFDPLRAGFFFREPDGSVQSASSRQEFIVKALGGKPDMVLPGDSALAPTAPAPVSPALEEPALSELESLDSALGPQPPPIFSNPRREQEPRPLPAVLAHNPRRAASSDPPPRWAWRSAVAAAAIAIALAGVLYSIGRSRASEGLSLRAVDIGGQLRIDWNRNSRVIEQSRSGAIEIEDGSLKVHDDLSQEHLRAGSITYLRTTGNVVVRLLVRGADQSTLTEISRFLGPSPATTVPIAIAVPIATTATIDAAREVGPVEPPSKQTPRPVRFESENVGRTLAVSAPARRQLVLPPTRVPHPAEPLLPAPPVIAANTAAAVAAFPQDPYRTVIPRLPVPGPLNPANQGPSSGKIIWTGKLARSGTIQILGNRASQGHITGGLPGAPVRVQVFPSELSQEGLRIFAADPRSIGAPEAAGAQNGWNRTVYVLNPRKAGEIGILEAPGQQNSWNRLILRAERGDHSIIVLRWERVPAESPLHAADNP
jgi:proteasome lid subunit RPN8/RPN11